MDPESLVLPPSIRLLRPDEVPVHDDQHTIRDRAIAGEQTRFVAGYVLKESGKPGYDVYAEVNVHAPEVWRLFRDLVGRLLPEHAALLIGVKDGELHHCRYRLKRELLTALVSYGEALGNDCFVQFGAIWQHGGTTEEVFVEPAKYIKIWTSQRRALEQVLAEHGLRQAERLDFLDEYPRVTEVMYHPPEMYGYDELIERVLRTEGELPA